MNVLFLSTWFPWPPDNGSKIRVYYLLRSLSERHQVTLASFAFGTAEPNDARDALGFCAGVHRGSEPTLSDRNRTSGVVRFLSPDPVVTRALPEMSQTVQALFSQQHFDVVIASIAVVAVYAGRAPYPVATVLEERQLSVRVGCGIGIACKRHRCERLRNWVKLAKSRLYEARYVPPISCLHDGCGTHRVATSRRWCRLPRLLWR